MSQFQNPQMITVALGATIGVIGAASLFIYQKIMENREREQMMNNLENVNKRVTELQIALDNLRAQQEQQKRHRRMNSKKRLQSQASYLSTAETDNEIDAISATETDIDDEFYDCSDDEIVPDDDIENGTGVKSLSEILDAIDEKINEGMYGQALFDLQSLTTKHDSNIEIVWRLAKVYFKMATELTDNKLREELLQEGMKACEKFVDEEHADFHKYYALMIGLRTEYLPVREKVTAGKVFEKHVRIGLKLHPDDPTLNHLLGRFQFSVAELSWIERKVCGALFGEAPTSSYEEAIKNLENAENFEKEPDLTNKYYLGVAYLKTKSYKKGVEKLKELCDLKPHNKDEEGVQSEATKLISTYSSYC